ncbi:unnamed protein product [Porites evermanni]|uniref:Uncharacterized protein n=1 Tax=Porites evermanni TaxID=104178 RepID=A0ABN8Q0K3_9CNID|nr:unnamed protein product [Porites evermanni]
MGQEPRGGEVPGRGGDLRDRLNAKRRKCGTTPILTYKEGEVEMDHDLDLVSPDFDLLDNLRSYLHGPTSPDETSEYDVRLDQPVEETSTSEDGRIVEISLPRGAQGPEAQKKLTSAFPHFRAKARQSHGHSNPPFQVLVTDKSARNNLVPANPPTHGFTARELHKVA